MGGTAGKAGKKKWPENTRELSEGKSAAWEVENTGMRAGEVSVVNYSFPGLFRISQPRYVGFSYHFNCYTIGHIQYYFLA